MNHNLIDQGPKPTIGFIDSGTTRITGVHIWWCSDVFIQYETFLHPSLPVTSCTKNEFTTKQWIVKLFVNDSNRSCCVKLTIFIDIVFWYPEPDWTILFNLCMWFNGLKQHIKQTGVAEGEPHLSPCATYWVTIIQYYTIKHQLWRLIVNIIKQVHGPVVPT